MEYRKIISFGNSSFVVSLPKDWVTTNKLEKGDSVSMEKNGIHELIIFPKPKSESDKHSKTITLNVNGKNIYEIKRAIVAAYLDNNARIMIVGDNLSGMSDAIRDIVTDLAAVEIMEQTSKKIVVRDFLDMNTILLNDIVRKIDLIIRNMITDSKENLNYPSAGHINISSRDKDVNRLAFLGTRIIRHYSKNPYFQKQLQMSTMEIYETGNVIQKLEGIGDAMKRIARYMEKNIGKINKNKEMKKDIKQLIEAIYTFYTDSMKAFYKRDRSLSNTIANKRPELTKFYDHCCDTHFKGPEMRPLVENFYALTNITRSLLRISYQISDV